MKKIILILAIVAGLGANVHAQDTSATKQRKMMKGGGHMEMFQELNLTDAQKEKVKTIMTAQRTKMNDIRNSTTLTDEQKGTQVKALRQDQRTQISAILTPEQKTKWEQMEADQKKNFKMKGKADSTKK